MSSSQPDLVKGEEAVESVSQYWKTLTGERPPVKDIEVQEGMVGHNFANFTEDGVVQVAEQMKEGKKGFFEMQLIEQFDEAYEEFLEDLVDEQVDVLRDRYSEVVDDFDVSIEGIQVAELEGARAHHGGLENKIHSNSFTLGGGSNDNIVFDYGVLHRVDPVEEEADFYIPQLARHEATHGLQAAMNPDFKLLSIDHPPDSIEKATTEGMAEYEQHKNEGKRLPRIVAQDKPWMMPSYWERSVAKQSATPTDPYSFGELAAYFIEEGHRQDFLEETASTTTGDEISPAVRLTTLDRVAENRTRRTLLDNPKREDLQERIAEAQASLDRLFYGGVVERVTDSMVENGELDYTVTEQLSNRLNREVNHISDAGPTEGELNTWYEANAVDQVYREFKDKKLEASEDLGSKIKEFEDAHLGYFDN